MCTAQFGSQHGPDGLRGFRITKDARNGIYKVRFRHRGKRFNLSTGTRNKKDAGVVAARIYA